MFILFSLVGKRIHKDYRVERASKHKTGTICRLNNRKLSNALHCISLVDIDWYLLIK